MKTNKAKFDDVEWIRFSALGKLQAGLGYLHGRLIKWVGDSVDSIGLIESVGFMQTLDDLEAEQDPEALRKWLHEIERFLANSGALATFGEN